MNRHQRRAIMRLHPDHKKDELIQRMQAIIEAQRKVISRYEQTIREMREKESNSVV